MTILDFFDVHNQNHLEAWDHLQRKGFWPEGFTNDEMEFPINWQFIILQKFVDAWMHDKGFKISG